MMRRGAAVLLVCVAACGPFFRPAEGDDDAPPRERLRLCVENATVAYGNLIARAGQVRFDVMPGQQVCKQVLEGGGYVDLRATTTGGGLSGPRRYQAQMPVGSYRCWLWRLTDSPASAGDLGPCREDEEEADEDADTASADTSRTRL